LAVHLYNCAYYRNAFHDNVADGWLFWNLMFGTWSIFA